mmetsp:Transcript_29063/g.58566  ORF Transcript_29063/g.58566 Transcript_29063/m.58566 type:complete len:207 (+) Transcript_29063:119-739(+)
MVTVPVSRLPLRVCSEYSINERPKDGLPVYQPDSSAIFSRRLPSSVSSKVTMSERMRSWSSSSYTAVLSRAPPRPLYSDDTTVSRAGSMASRSRSARGFQAMRMGGFQKKENTYSRPSRKLGPAYSGEALAISPIPGASSETCDTPNQSGVEQPACLYAADHTGSANRTHRPITEAKWFLGAVKPCGSPVTSSMKGTFSMADERKV